MGKYRLAFVAFDSAKEKHAVAIADEGRDGEVRYLVDRFRIPNLIIAQVMQPDRAYRTKYAPRVAG
jgi:transposase